MTQRLWNNAALMAALVGGLALFGGRPQPARADTLPKRIVSLNLCTDQLVMMLAGPERIAAVSHLALDPQISVLAEDAKKLPINYGQAEEVFLLKPDLVVAGSFHLNATVDILRRLGVRIEEFGSANSFAEIRDNVRRMGRLLGAEEKAETLIAEFDGRLDRVDKEQTARPALAALYYANSYTSGADTLAAEVVERAGFNNLGSQLGLKGTSKLPLEMLIMKRPDLVITGLAYEAPALAQEVFEHPALAYLERRSKNASVAEKLWICGTPYTAGAVEDLAQVRHSLPAETAAVAGADKPQPAALPLERR